METLLYFHESDTFPYRPIPPIWIIIYISLSFLFFLIIDRLVTSISTNNNPRDFKDGWLKHNTLLSFIHSTLCSLLLTIAALRAPEMFDDPLSHSNMFNYAVIAFSVGYFVWDFFACLKNSTASTFPILLHHIVVITFLTHTLVRTRNIGYALYALSLEVNSVFLHARRLLRWYSSLLPSVYAKQILELFIDIGNYITFIIFRFAVVVIALRVLYMEPHRLEPIILVFTVLSVCTIGVMNVILFYRLLKNQFSQKRKSKLKNSDDDNVLMTDNDILLPS